MDLSILILNYNGWKMTLNCVKSILKSKIKKIRDYEILILDNGSLISEIEPLQTNLPQKKGIKLFRSKINLGFAGGNNFLLSKSKGDVVFFLNNDTIITSGLIDIGYWLSINNENDLFSPIVIYSKKRHEKEKIWFGGIRFKVSFNKFSYRLNIPKENIYLTDMVTGCAFFMNRNLFQRLKYVFDSRTFLQGEETDLEFRIRKKANGSKSYVFNHGEQVVHLVSASSPGKLQWYYFVRNRIINTIIYLKGMYRIYAITMDFYYNLGQTVGLIPKFGISVVKITIKAYIHGLINSYRVRSNPDVGYIWEKEFPSFPVK